MNQSAIHRMLAGVPPDGRESLAQGFRMRLAANMTLLQEAFLELYPGREKDFERFCRLLEKQFGNRPDALKRQDVERLRAGNWYQSQQWVGMQLYVDRFAGDLKSLEAKIPYFESLGINYLHLMPLTQQRRGENDGGYAVNSYTEVDSRFGSQEDLERLTQAFRDKGILLMLDFVVNHTADSFPWAQKARAGDPFYQAFYYTYPDRNIPDQFEASLPEIFPESSPGNFSWIPGMEKWVMTVFNSYQWDLNYRNPEVFLAMFENLTDLAGLGVDVVRFDALAFLWKKVGTASQNLPEAHSLISLFRLGLQVVAPGVILLAEAIVAPHEIVRYFGEGRMQGNACEIAYHATFMACLWNSIATKKTRLLRRSLEHMPPKPNACTWINYIRCHDDIGLGFDDAHIQALGWNPPEHRKFLLDYYCQRLDWSPAKGAIFMYNPANGDGRITGTAASLLGLEKALESGEAEATARAVARIRLMHGLILAAAGIPMIYAGDELGMCNDYSYLKDPDRAGDSRWLNRPFQDWEKAAALDQADLSSSMIFETLRHLIRIRKNNPVFADLGNVEYPDAGNEHIFAMQRSAGTEGVMVLGNFDEKTQVVNAGWLSRLGYLREGSYTDLVSGETREVHSGLLELDPLALLWLRRY